MCSFFCVFLSKKIKVPTKYSYGMLFCSCPAGDQTACAERRRQTIVPICSYEDKDTPNCLSLQNTCKTNYICRYDSTGASVKNILFFFFYSLQFVFAITENIVSQSGGLFHHLHVQQWLEETILICRWQMSPPQKASVIFQITSVLRQSTSQNICIANWQKIAALMLSQFEVTKTNSVVYVSEHSLLSVLQSRQKLEAPIFFFHAS